MSKSKEIANVVSGQQLAELRDSFPAEPTFNRIILPRLGLVSQDVVEGRGKDMKVTSEAGTFFIEHQSEELDEDGKKKWVREEIGTEIEGTIFYSRNQLRYYDEKTETYTSSPIFDNPNDVLPLFQNKSEVARGTVAELKKKYEYTDKDGKVKSKLEDNRILYVMYKDEAYQMNLRGSSMYAFQKYARTTLAPSVVTSFGSEAREKGTIAWNQMTFKVARVLSADEADKILSHIKEFKDFVAAEKSFYAPKAESSDKALDEFAGTK